MGRTRIRETTWDSYSALTLENDELSIVTIPELGGKIISFVGKCKGFDPVFTNPNTGLVKYAYDSAYQTSDSGIGELLPSIGVGVYPEAPWNGVPLPDKGELWTQEFATSIQRDSVVQKVRGVRFPYEFTRKLRLRKNALLLDYTLENLCSFGFKYIWSLQPHLVLTTDMEIALDGPGRFYVDWSKNRTFETRTKKYEWPVAVTVEGTQVDFSRIRGLDGNAEKLFLTEFAKGEVRLLYHDRGMAITWHFDNRLIANCGLWINRAGWPLAGKPTELIAVQPCTSTSDFFEDTCRQGSITVAAARSVSEWSVQVAVDSL